MSSVRAVVNKFCKAMESADYPTAAGLLSNATARFGPASSLNMENVIPWAGTHAVASKCLESFLTYVEKKNFVVTQIMVDGNLFHCVCKMDAVVRSTGKIYPFEAYYTGAVGEDMNIKWINVQVDTYSLARMLQIGVLEKMPGDITKEVANKLYDAMKIADVKTALEMLSTTYVYCDSLDQACKDVIPWAGFWAHGSACLETLTKYAEIKDFYVRSLIVEGENYCCEISSELEAKSTHKVRSFDVIQRGVVKNGKLTELKIWTDTYTLAQHLAEGSGGVARMVAERAKETEEVVTKFHRAMRTGDLKTATEMTSSATVYFGSLTEHDETSKVIPWAGYHKSGREFFEIVSRNVEFKKFEMSNLMVSGERFYCQVAVDVETKGTHKTCPNDGIHCGVVREGRLVELKVWTDTFKLAQIFSPAPTTLPIKQVQTTPQTHVSMKA